MATSTKARKTRKVISEAERERRAQQHKEKAAALHASLEAKVEAMASSEDWKGYLDHARSFHSYSFNNMMLIWFACPDATQVAGFKAWQEKGRQVRKGEKGIPIFGFSSYKKWETDEETGEKSYRIVKYFPTVYVFDVSQTEPITEDMIDEIRAKNPKAKLFSQVPASPVRLLQGEDDAKISQHVINYLADKGWSLQFEEITDGSNGYAMFDGSKKIAVRHDLSPAATAKTALHELGHAMAQTDFLGTGEAADDAPKDRAVRELEAESIAYVVAGVLGLDTSDYSIGYLTGWSGGKGEAVAATAERVLKTANKILEEVFPLTTAEDTE